MAPRPFNEIPNERQAIAWRKAPDPRESGSLSDTDWYRFFKSEADSIRELQGAFPTTGPAAGVSWTPLPTLTFGGAAVGMTYSVQFGRAFQVGPLVFFSMQLTLTAKGASVGAALINGLPFLASAESSPPCSHSFTNMTAGVGDTMTRASVVGGTTTVQPAKIAAGAYAQLTDADFTNTSNLRLDGWYYTAP